MEKNINAARRLLEKYKSITLEMITETWERIKDPDPEANPFFSNSGSAVLKELTGFGSLIKCLLCTEARQLAQQTEYARNNPAYCFHCIYVNNVQKLDSYLCVEDTYRNLMHAETPQEIYSALQLRIEFLQKAIQDYEKDQAEENNN